MFIVSCDNRRWRGYNGHRGDTDSHATKRLFFCYQPLCTTALLGPFIRGEQDSDWVFVTLFSVSAIQWDLIHSDLRTGDFLSRFREAEVFINM